MSKMYYRGETMRQNVEVRAAVNGALVDPDTIVITIIDPDGITEEEKSMIKTATGEYYYDYLLGSDEKIGKWKTEIKAVKGFTQIEQDEFTVMEAF